MNWTALDKTVGIDTLPSIIQELLKLPNTIISGSYPLKTVLGETFGSNDYDIYTSLLPIDPRLTTIFRKATNVGSNLVIDRGIRYLKEALTFHAKISSDKESKKATRWSDSEDSTSDSEEPTDSEELGPTSLTDEQAKLLVQYSAFISSKLVEEIALRVIDVIIDPMPLHRISDSSYS